jgi:hypothetical protein
MSSEEKPSGIDQVLETPDLGVALESDWFKQLLIKSRLRSPSLS